MKPISFAGWQSRLLSGGLGKYLAAAIIGTAAATLPARMKKVNFTL